MMQRYKQLVPVIFLTVCCLVTAVTAIQGNILIADESVDFAIDYKHYSGMAIIAVAIIIFFQFRSFYKYILAAILLLAMFRVIGFAPLDFYIGFGADDARIQFDVVARAFGILVYGINFAKINAAIFGLLKPSDEKLTRIRQEEIDEFKRNSFRKSTEELAQIVKASSLVPSALAAAKQLLKARQQSA